MTFPELIQTLQMTLKALMMYTDAHPRSQEALDTLATGVSAWLKERPKLYLAASNGKLFLDGAPMENQGIHGNALAKQLTERQISGFILEQGVTQSDLLGMLKILILKPAKLDELGGPVKLLADYQVQHITLGQVQYREIRESDLDGSGAGAEEAPALMANPTQDGGASGQGSQQGEGSQQGQGPAAPERDEDPLPLGSTGFSPSPAGPGSPTAIPEQDWARLTLEEKLRRALEGQAFWDLAPQQRLALLERLLELEHFEDFLELMERQLMRLSSERPEHRQEAAQDLAEVANWMKQPGLPMALQGPLFQGLIAHFAWEPIPAVHRPSAFALERALISLPFHRDFAHVMSLMGEVNGLLALSEDQQPWRVDARNHLMDRLGDIDAVGPLIEQLYRAETEDLITELLPYLEFLGQPVAHRLVERLGYEPDRRNRARLMEAIRALGATSIPALTESLRSPTWFVVRNTLNLLADLGDAGLLPLVTPALVHPDLRVQASAVRAAWKLGAQASVPPLVVALPAAPPETQLEILFGLGHLHATAAAPAILELGRSALDPKVRLKALEVLTLLPEPRSLPALSELLKRKGRIFTSAEPTEIRLAAAKAIRAMDTPEAMQVLKTVLAAEPRNRDRELLLQHLGPLS
ncbi:MAG: HEAT repeat domain-containing protein [Firmicutes bacterium]|nr:HEAT repeat domain-containing protein [Bacillota bacterium]